MRVLLTGANGFVGSHIAESLAEKGHGIVCLARRTSDLKWLGSLKAEFRYCDVRGEIPPEAVKGIDAVVHAAGVVRAADTQTYYQVNQFGTRKLVEAVIAANPGLRKFVYLSSQAAMGPAPKFSLKSMDEPENPVSDYGKSKLAGEKELKLLENNVPFTILRPASVYGPRDKDIFIFFNLVNRGLRPMPLRKRYLQLVYVKDVAQAVLNSLENDRTDGKTYVLAERTPFTWEDIGKTISEAIHKRTIPLPLPDLAFHVASVIAEQASRIRRAVAVLNRQKVEEMLQDYWLADVEPAYKDLGMDFTNLSFGAKITYLWYKENRWF